MCIRDRYKCNSIAYDTSFRLVQCILHEFGIAGHEADIFQAVASGHRQDYRHEIMSYCIGNLVTNFSFFDMIGRFGNQNQNANLIEQIERHRQSWSYKSNFLSPRMTFREMNHAARAARVIPHDWQVFMQMRSEVGPSATPTVPHLSLIHISEPTRPY